MKKTDTGGRLKGIHVAILVTDYFEQVELTKPREALEKAGAHTHIITPHGKRIVSMNHDEKGEEFTVDMTLEEADPDSFDAVLLPGGVMNSDKLRTDRNAQRFIQRIDETDKPIASICHAPWLLVSAGLVKGRMMTSYYTLQDDIRNAGGRWLDREVVHDWNWVSSRNPDDLPTFIDVMTTLFEQYSVANNIDVELLSKPSTN